METADRVRARLRHELQQAYAAWLLASQRDDFRDCDRDAGQAADTPRAKTGIGPTVKDLWASYQAARARLIEATTRQAQGGTADAGTEGLR